MCRTSKSVSYSYWRSNETRCLANNANKTRLTRCQFFSLFTICLTKQRRFLQEHNDVFAFLMIRTRAWSSRRGCLSLSFYYVCHWFIQSSNTNRIHLRERALTYLATKGSKRERKKEKKKNYTECCLLLRSLSLSKMIDEFLLYPLGDFLCSLIN